MGATWCGGVTAGDCNCNRAVVGGRVYIHTHTICFPFEKQSKCCGRGWTYEKEGHVGVVVGGREEERRMYRGGRDPSGRISIHRTSIRHLCTEPLCDIYTQNLYAISTHRISMRYLHTEPRCGRCWTIPMDRKSLRRKEFQQKIKI
jgi:hypothetical protein